MKVNNRFKWIQEQLKDYGSAFPQQIGPLRPNWLDGIDSGEVSYGIAYMIAVDGVEFEVVFHERSGGRGWDVTARSHDYSELHGFEEGPLAYKKLGARKTIKGIVSLARKYVNAMVVPLVRKAQRQGATLFVPDPEER